jgi:hypothetical protein
MKRSLASSTSLAALIPVTLSYAPSVQAQNSNIQTLFAFSGQTTTTRSFTVTP